MQIQVSRVYSCRKKQINRGSIFIHFAYTSLGPLVDHMIIDFMTRRAIYYHKDVALVTATHFLVTPQHRPKTANLSSHPSLHSMFKFM